MMLKKHSVYNNLPQFVLFITVICVFFVCCNKAEEIVDALDRNSEIMPYTPGIRIAWDYSTLNKPFSGPIFYPRMTRLHNGDLILSFENNGNCFIIKSVDEGKTWSQPILVASAFDNVVCANPFPIQLHNGTLLLAYNSRPPSNNLNESKRFGIQLAESSDNGISWRFLTTVFEGGYTWDKGVWEPAIVQLENGRLLLFFANEFPYDNGDQEISMVYSDDNGKTWSHPITISYREGYRDGMPAPLLLHNDSLVIAIEDNGIVPDIFKPVILHLSSNDFVNNFDDFKYITGIDERREEALANNHRLPVFAYGGAPFLAQFPSGETILSFQTTAGRLNDWDYSTMVVAVGNHNAQNFCCLSQPFYVPNNRRALWNSLFVLNNDTVVALSSTDAFNDGKYLELYTIKGYRIEEPIAYYDYVSVDGELNEKVWDIEKGLFVGGYSLKKMLVKFAWSDDMFYASFLITDDFVDVNYDAVSIILAMPPVFYNYPSPHVYKLVVRPNSDYEFFVGNEGVWKKIEEADILIKSSYHDFKLDYSIEIGIPWNLLDVNIESLKTCGVTVGSVNKTVDGKIVEEWLSGTDENHPNTYMMLIFER